MKPQPNILEAIRDERLLGHGFKRKWLRGDTWRNWRGYLCGLFHLPFESDEQRATFLACTGRTTIPSAAFRESFLVCGRRSGKTYLTAAIGTYLAAFRDYSPYLAPGETATVAIVAADRDQAQILLRYIRGFFQASPVLRAMLHSDLKETITLKSGVTIEVLTADYRSVRGRTLAAVLVDEIAFLQTGDAGELLSALRPALISIPDSILVALTSPYSKRGPAYEAFQKFYGRDDAETLVFRASSLTMNPSLSSLAIKAAFLRDPVAARTEFNAEWREGIDNFLSEEILDACTIPNRKLIAYSTRFQYSCFVDAGGGKSDSFCMAIGHRDRDKAIVDLILEREAPYSPAVVAKEMADVAHLYQCFEVHGDRYGSSWTSDSFERNGLIYRQSEKPKSDLYMEALPVLTSGGAELLDHPKMRAQFLGLERRAGRGGRDTVDHGPGAHSHDDVCNVVSGLLYLLSGGIPVFGFLDLTKKIQAGEISLTPEAPADDKRAARTKRQIEIEAMRRSVRRPYQAPTRAAYSDEPVAACHCGGVRVRIGGGGLCYRCSQCGEQTWPEGRPKSLYMSRSRPVLK